MTSTTSFRASILIPTHNRPKTLRLAAQSALKQTVRDLEVILIGDGVTDGLRREAQRLVREDSRVVFLDLPKSAHHGEPYRHEAIVNARSDAIFYLCDDDLLMPEHVSELLKLLKSHNFVQSLNGYIHPSGLVDFYPADLSDPETISWHLRVHEPHFFNSVSLTGTAHSRAFYLDVGAFWETTPPGRAPDHYQWCKMFASPKLRAATSTRMTALQFPTTSDDRHLWTETKRLAELTSWAKIVAAPDGQDRIDELVRQGAHVRMAQDMRTIFQLKVDRTLLQNKLSAFTSSTSWRLTRPLRNLRRLLMGAPRGD